MGTIESLSVSTTTWSHWTVLVVAGELDLYSQQKLQEQVPSILGQPKIALDLSGVTFMDSSGLGTLVGILRDVRERGGECRIVAGADGPVARLLSLTGLEEQIELLPERSSLGGSPA